MLTYEAYQEMGGTLAEPAFKRLEARAAARIRLATHGRIASENPVREAAQYCAYELIEAMRSDEESAGMSGREVASMSNDGVSITYASGAAAGDGASASAQRDGGIVRRWLLGETTADGVGLLYAGVDA